MKEMEIKTCGKCQENDDGLCDRYGILVEDEDTCRRKMRNEAISDGHEKDERE